MAEVAVASLDPRQRKWIENACSALERGEFDYVIDATTEVLKTAPGCLVVRRLQRVAQRRRQWAWRERLLAKVRRSVSSSRWKAGRSRQDPAQLLAKAEAMLAADPENTGALRLLADAAAGMALPETRVFALEAIRELEPDNYANLLALGEGWLAVARPADALKLAGQMLATWPGDEGAQELMRTASVAQTVAQPDWKTPADRQIGAGTQRG